MTQKSPNRGVNEGNFDEEYWRQGTNHEPNKLKRFICPDERDSSRGEGFSHS